MKRHRNQSIHKNKFPCFYENGKDSALLNQNT